MLIYLGNKYGTDKVGHGYLPIYQNYLGWNRLVIENVVEIGIAQGASLKMWRDFFPNAIIHGIDLFDKSIYNEDRIKTYIGDQGNMAFLHDFAYPINPIDLIIDDGSHKCDDQIKSFNVLFKSLKSGGYYIIEDLHTAYHKDYSGSSIYVTIMDYLKEFLDYVNEFGGNFSDYTHKLSRSAHIAKDIESMHFYKSTCIIKKR